jgi:hypothetical protein
MEEQSIEQLLSVIELQKNALLYYGDKKNYENESIKNDMGSLANFTLKQSNNILLYNKNLINQLEALSFKNNDFNSDEFKKTMNELHKLDQTIEQINIMLKNEKNGDIQ